MNTIRLTAVITEEHELNLTVPDDVPIGNVEVLIRQMPSTPSNNPAREAARTKLAAAGLLSSASYLPPGTRIPSDAEVAAAGILPPNVRPSEALVSEDRDER